MGKKPKQEKHRKIIHVFRQFIIPSDTQSLMLKNLYWLPIAFWAQFKYLLKIKAHEIPHDGFCWLLTFGAQGLFMNKASRLSWIMQSANANLEPIIC